jgi:hypothetical protein
LVLFIPPRDEARPPRPRAGVVRELAKLADIDARRLDGHWARFVVQVDSEEDERGGFVVFDCPSKNDAHQTVWL